MNVAKRIGLLFATVHLIIFIIFVYFIHVISTEGQSRLLWTIWLPFDFPISLLVSFGFDLIPPDNGTGSTIRYWLPYFVHGGLGTIWWYFIPVILRSFFLRIGRKTKS